MFSSLFQVSVYTSFSKKKFLDNFEKKMENTGKKVMSSEYGSPW
jgi:hypothetical protein